MLLGFFSRIEECFPEKEGHVKAWFEYSPYFPSAGGIKALDR